MHLKQRLDQITLIRLINGPRNDFIVGGGQGPITKCISIKIYTTYAGSSAEPQPTNDLVHFSLKI